MAGVVRASPTCIIPRMARPLCVCVSPCARRYTTEGEVFMFQVGASALDWRICGGCVCGGTQCRAPAQLRGSAEVVVRGVEAPVRLGAGDMYLVAPGAAFKTRVRTHSRMHLYTLPRTRHGARVTRCRAQQEPGAMRLQVTNRVVADSVR